MTFSKVFVCGVGLAALAACVPMDPVEIDRESLPTAPEFLPCHQVDDQLAYADEAVRRISYSTNPKEAAYWEKRQERLVARAYECKR